MGVLSRLNWFSELIFSSRDFKVGFLSIKVTRDAIISPVIVEMRFLILFGQCGRGFTGSLRIGKERKTFMSWNPLICEDQFINFINFEALKIYGVKEVTQGEDFTYSLHNFYKNLKYSTLILL